LPSRLPLTNIDLLKFDSHTKTNDFINDLNRNGIMPLITKPTRVTEHSATIIDHMHTNIVDGKFKSGIIISDVADHFATFTILFKHKHNDNLRYKDI
jgi:hypothetical protein